MSALGCRESCIIINLRVVCLHYQLVTPFINVCVIQYTHVGDMLIYSSHIIEIET